MNKQRLQKLAGITELLIKTPPFFKYCWIQHYDYHELRIATQDSFNEYIEELMEDNDVERHEVLEWFEYLEEIPESNVIFILWNDEGPRVYSYKNVEEFVNDVGLDCWDLISSGDIPETDEYFDNINNKFTKKGIELAFVKLKKYINNSEADGDSSSACMLIINNKIIASSPYKEI